MFVVVPVCEHDLLSNAFAGNGIYASGINREQWSTGIQWKPLFSETKLQKNSQVGYLFLFMFFYQCFISCCNALIP